MELEFEVIDSFYRVEGNLKSGESQRTSTSIRVDTNVHVESSREGLPFSGYAVPCVRDTPPHHAARNGHSVRVTNITFETKYKQSGLYGLYGAT